VCVVYAVLCVLGVCCVLCVWGVYCVVCVLGVYCVVCVLGVYCVVCVLGVYCVVCVMGAVQLQIKSTMICFVVKRFLCDKILPEDGYYLYPKHVRYLIAYVFNKRFAIGWEQMYLYSVQCSCD
jgi:hypothetical protein